MYMLQLKYKLSIYTFRFMKTKLKNLQFKSEKIFIL